MNEGNQPDRSEKTASQTKPRSPILGELQRREGAASISGTAAPIVWFKQLRKFASTHGGRGVFGALGSSESAAVSLYPSRVRTTLLAL